VGSDYFFDFEGFFAVSAFFGFAAGSAFFAFGADGFGGDFRGWAGFEGGVSTGVSPAMSASEMPAPGKMLEGPRADRLIMMFS